MHHNENKGASSGEKKENEHSPSKSSNSGSQVNTFWYFIVECVRFTANFNFNLFKFSLADNSPDESGSRGHNTCLQTVS